MMLLPTGSICSIFYTILLLNVHIKLINSSKCNRTPDGHGALQTPADGRFHIRILQNTDRYTPGKNYSIKLEGIDAAPRSMGSAPPSKYKFSGFTLVVERKFNLSTAKDSPSTFGVFNLLPGDTLTQITCANMVKETTAAPKGEIQVFWTAPQAGSGCVAFKATVIEHRDVWYMDDGPLTKEFCEEEQNFDDEFSAPIICRACTEAKYELTFEGLWSRNTHPKKFPDNNWVTKFSDIIGASHTSSYRFWKHGQIATDGLMQVAEHGSTQELESELKSQREEIRTIIKAKGLAYPDVTGKTFAVFRVDPTHSQVSFVTMIDPSPDWFLGVSGLELCRDDGSWIESRTIDLYPWDAGTDSGASYESANAPTNPREHIRRIRADYPNDPRSPFYDPDGNMKPLARLYVSRQRLYERNCPEETDESGDSRTRPSCIGANCNDRSDETDEPPTGECQLSDWSAWGDCSTRCGKGTKTRTRYFIGRNRKGCSTDERLEERKPCSRSCSTEISNTGNGDEDGQVEPDENKSEESDTECQPSEWSDWQRCNVTCGNGFKVRTRTRISGECDENDLQQLDPCKKRKCPSPEFCKQGPHPGDCKNGTVNKYFYNPRARRCDTFGWSCGTHRNKFETMEDCWNTCVFPISKPHETNSNDIEADENDDS